MVPYFQLIFLHELLDEYTVERLLNCEEIWLGVFKHRK